MANEHIERRMTYILRKIFCQRNEEEKADNAAVFVAICSGCIETKMAKFLLFLWRNQICSCSSINITYELDSAEIRPLNGCRIFVG